MNIGGTVARKSDRRPWRFSLLMYIIGFAALIAALPVADAKGMMNPLTMLLLAVTVVSIFLGWKATEDWKWRQANLPQREVKRNSETILSTREKN